MISFQSNYRKWIQGGINPFTKIRVIIYVGILLLMTVIGCKKDTTPTTPPTPPSSPTGYQQVNLVSDISGFGAGRTDANLVNPWGISFGPSGDFWIATNGSGGTVVYDSTGTQLLPFIAIPFNGDRHGSAPTGTVYNGTGDFGIPSHGASFFIYSTEDGILSAWGPQTSDSTVTVVDSSSSGAVYKGLALANDGGTNYLYATDFHNNKIDVFGSTYNGVHLSFVDPGGIPAGFAPFNIQNIGGQLYVTYAKQDTAAHDDVAGPGNGFVDIFTPHGTFVKRFASQGTLNSPWGITQAPAGFGEESNSILVGNFGDGKINVFDSTGTYKSQLEDNGNVIGIGGLWDITFIPGGVSNKLFFTAGPVDESHGIFGYIQKR